MFRNISQIITLPHKISSKYGTIVVTLYSYWQVPTAAKNCSLISRLSLEVTCKAGQVSVRPSVCPSVRCQYFQNPKGVFIATELNWTQLTQLNSVQPSQSCFCLWRHDLQTTLSSWVQLRCVEFELSWVELCRYKHPLKLRDRWADVDETWRVYSMGRGTKLPESGIWIFGRCIARERIDDPPRTV